LSKLQTSAKESSLDSKGAVTLQLSDRLSVRLYRDCRPSCLETGALQKGLVLLLDGRELIEEGVGFGVPVVKYEDKTFFSSSAEVSVQPSDIGFAITKVYSLDTVSLKKFGKTAYISDVIYSPVRKNFHSLYSKYKKLSPLFNKAMELRDLAKIKTEFKAVKPRGTVTVTYNCQPMAINIRADFSNITLSKCCEVLVLNEQGASVFQKYVDSSGINLICRKIGAWESVTATQASLQNLSGKISFSLQNHRGAALFRGWEYTKKRFSWTGLSYSMKPTRCCFGYTVELRLKTD
jgi:hypothetical protein